MPIVAEKEKELFGIPHLDKKLIKAREAFKDYKGTSAVKFLKRKD